MAEKINLRNPGYKARQRQVQTYGTQTPLSSTAVERGSTRWLNGSMVVIEGLLDVTGVLNVSGQTTLSGATTIAGPTGITGALTIQGVTTITGQLDVTGPTKLNGKLDIGGDTTVTGKLDITGKTTIKNDLELLSGGLFKAGSTKIEPNGKATFGTFIIDPASDKLIQAPGGWLVSAGPDSLGLSSSSSSSVQLNSTRAELNYKGESVVRAESGIVNLNAPQISVNGNLVATGTARFSSLTTGAAGTPANVHIDSSGRLWRANP